MVTSICENIGGAAIFCGRTIIHIKSAIFHKVNYIDPIYKIIKYIEHLIPVAEGGRPPLFNYLPANVRNHKTSSGKHLSSYFARKRRLKNATIIYQNNKNTSNIDNTNENFNQKSTMHPTTYDASIPSFSIFDDPSCQDTKWYDAISPCWTGGMVWNGAYVLNHQVVSVTTDPVFISNLLPALELPTTIQAPEARSEDDNVGPRATIALDSGSSIHIFKDAFLLMDIHSDDKRSIGVRTTDSKFRVNDIGRLCDDLNTLPLPSDGYYFYPKGVANILSLALIAETKRVVMDSTIDDVIYIFNEDGSYVRFSKTHNGMYCIDITTDDNDHVVMAHQTVKGESAHFSAIDCRRAAKIRELQEALACPSDFDLANAIEHNVIGNNPFTRRDVRIAKQIFGPDVPAMKGKTVKNKSKMPREDDITGIPPNIMKEYSNIIYQSASCTLMVLNSLYHTRNTLECYKPIVSGITIVKQYWIVF
jgi:hypothetical protein